MFCEKCGTQLPDDAAFCTNCGASTSSSGNQNSHKVEKKIVDDEVQLNVKPTFKFGYMVAPTIIIYWAIILIVVIMLAIFTLETAMIVLIFGLGIFILYGIFFGIGVVVKKKQYDNYTYDFYKTKVIYRDSFLNRSEKEVKYKYIREVGMRQTFFQRFFNLGNIVLYTNAETGYGNGIYIMNIEDVHDIYKKIKTIIDV